MPNLRIAEPLTLPSGVVLPNRLAKAAMAEGWARSPDRLPHHDLIATYELWARGGWGLLITGNVQVDDAYLGTAQDVALSSSSSSSSSTETQQVLSQWAAAAAASTGKKGAVVVVQLNHPGRQTTLGAGSRPYLAKSLAPSAVGVSLGPGYLARAASALVFGTPRAMTAADIDDVVRRFGAAAAAVRRAGFDGVEVHAAHGYLLSSFLSRRSNRREDAYGGGARARARIVVEVVRAIRAAADAVDEEEERRQQKTADGRKKKKPFCIGVKVNSADHQSEEELKECIEQIEEISAAGIDFLEISGGSYENPVMMTSTTAQPSSTAARESFFLDFAAAIRAHFPRLLLMVTGGFRTRLGLEHAVRSGACDLVGLGRPAVLEPQLPSSIVFNADVADEDARFPTVSFARTSLARCLGMKGLGGGTETVTTVKDAGPSLLLRMQLLRDPAQAKIDASAAIASPDTTPGVKAVAWIVFAKASVIEAQAEDAATAGDEDFDNERHFHDKDDKDDDKDDDKNDSGTGEGGWFMWIEARAGFEEAKELDGYRAAEADAGIALCNKNIERIEDGRPAETRFGSCCTVAEEEARRRVAL